VDERERAAAVAVTAAAATDPAPRGPRTHPCGLMTLPVIPVTSFLVIAFFVTPFPVTSFPGDVIPRDAISRDAISRDAISRDVISGDVISRNPLPRGSLLPLPADPFSPSPRIRRGFPSTPHPPWSSRVRIRPLCLLKLIFVVLSSSSSQVWSRPLFCNF